MADDAGTGFPERTSQERDLLLDWLRYLRGAVIRKAQGLTEEQARWRPDGALISLLGIVNHLTRVEWRWIDGAVLGHRTERSEDEFEPGPALSLDEALAAYRARAVATEAAVAALSSLDRAATGHEGVDLRWVLLHLINETARHAGHADAVRELLDGTTGE